MHVHGLGVRFRVQDYGLGFRVRGLGFRVQGSGLGFRVSGFGFRVSGFGFRVSCFGFRVSGLECRVRGACHQGFAFGGSLLEFMVLDVGSFWLRVAHVTV